MPRLRIAGGALTLLLALLLAAPASDAQDSRRWKRPGVPGGTFAVPAPPQTGRAPPAVMRRAPALPNYYLERRGPVAAPRARSAPDDIAASLRARGFRDIAPVRRRGNTLIVPQATGPSGERVQLVVTPRGEIVGVRVLGAGGR